MGCGSPTPNTEADASAWTARHPRGLMDARTPRHAGPPPEHRPGGRVSVHPVWSPGIGGHCRLGSWLPRARSLLAGHLGGGGGSPCHLGKLRSPRPSEWQPQPVHSAPLGTAIRSPRALVACAQPGRPALASACGQGLSHVPGLGVRLLGHFCECPFRGLAGRAPAAGRWGQCAPPVLRPRPRAWPPLGEEPPPARRPPSTPSSPGRLLRLPGARRLRNHSIKCSCTETWSQSNYARKQEEPLRLIWLFRSGLPSKPRRDAQEGSCLGGQPPSAARVPRGGHRSDRLSPKVAALLRAGRLPFPVSHPSLGLRRQAAIPLQGAGVEVTLGQRPAQGQGAGGGTLSQQRGQQWRACGRFQKAKASCRGGRGWGPGREAHSPAAA